MDVAVFVAGVADPKWPLPAQLDAAALALHGDRHATLSPFDEAALELALKLRDADPHVRVIALVAGNEPLTRRVAAWRPDSIHRIELADAPGWDANAIAEILAEAAHALAPGAGLALIGREFGDYDEGSVPPALAHRLDARYIGLALAVERRSDALDVLRQGSTGLERLRVRAAALLSVTNEPGNRLRHPLMKNVMAAKKGALAVWRPDRRAALVHLEGVQPLAARPRRAACEWLEGSAEQKARSLANYLAEARRVSTT